MVLGVEEANGEDRHWHSDYGTHYKVEDGHATLPGKRHGTLCSRLPIYNLPY